MKKVQALGRTLSKEEQKKVLGGDYGGGSCTSSACSLVVNIGGSYVTYQGTCATYVVSLPGGGVTGVCYCYTSYSSTPPPLSSNGGSSRCNA